MNALTGAGSAHDGGDASAGAVASALTGAGGARGAHDAGGVLVLLPGALRDCSGGADQITVPVGDGLTVGGVLDALAARWPALERRVRDESGAVRRHVNLFVDGQDIRSVSGLQTSLAAGSELRVLPSVAGG